MCNDILRATFSLEKLKSNVLKDIAVKWRKNRGTGKMAGIAEVANNAVRK